MKVRIGIAADDVTGANDIGIMFAKHNYRSAVFPLSLLSGHSLSEEAKGLDVIILDTDSRFDDANTAARKVETATRLLREAGCELFYNKTCSVFRGNIGAELDAMQDELGITCSMVIAGFPKNGRTTVDGIHYVYNERLEHSQFSHDPIHPLQTSSLKEIMERQTGRPIKLLTWRELDRGYDYCRETMELFKKECAYILFDVRNQVDLKLIAKLVKSEKNICGSSALAEELPAAFEWQQSGSGLPVLTLAGSLTEQSAKQIAYMREKGYPVFEFPIENLYEPELQKRDMDALEKSVKKSMQTNHNVVVHTPNRPEQIKESRQKGRNRSLTDEEIGKKISGALCGLAEKVMNGTGCRRVVAAGGDTSASLTQALNIYRMDIISEIEPGLPVMRGTSSLGEICLVLKSGSFGSDAFLEKAAEAVRMTADRSNYMKHIDRLIERYPVLEPEKAVIQQAYEKLRVSFENGGKLLVCGNGGSAADADHIVGELMKGFYKKRPLSQEEQGRYGELSPFLQGALPAVSLTQHSALSTAYLNDVAPDMVFAQQVYGYGNAGDVFLGISTSGNSKNVVNAAKTAKIKGMCVISLTGQKGGLLNELSEVLIPVPSEITPDIQELHLPIYHTLCAMLEEHFFIS